MKLLTQGTATVSRKYLVFSNFKDSKRVRWAQYRKHGY